MSVAEFYDAVGEHELASEYRLRNGLKWGLGAGLGIPLVVGGLVAVMVAIAPPDDTTSLDAKAADDNSDLIVAGSVMMGVGMVGIAAVLLIDVDTHSYDQKRKMSDAHNRRLRDKLGLDQSDPVVRVAPTATNSGAGVSVFGQF